MAENGNGAAMREALNQLRDWALLDINENAIRPDEPNYRKLVDGIVEITNAALDAPTRNCDRFTNWMRAWDGYLEKYPDARQETPFEIGRFHHWLFAPAKGEGGVQ